MSAKANSIQVCIKLRPCEPGDSSLWQVMEGRSIQLADSHADPSVFDYVFDEGAGNQEVFDRMAQHIVRACMQGFNGTIFAYGQTSSGKTYTMMGDGQNPGVMVLAAKEIFQQIANDTERDFLLRVGYIEIYNEKIYDLLNKKNQDLKIHEAGNGIVNVNCEECIITTEEDLLRLLCLGNKERTVGETNMNERSSRSHAIFRIIIESRKSDRTDDDAVIQSVLNLVDLAGSERADQTGATGARLKEGAHINKSLMFLSNVIKNLSENVDNKFISFRDSKLTRILQASLGGNAFTSIICTIKPSIIDESQSTLNFAIRAKKIRIKPQVNEMVSDATMMKRLEREIKTLKSQLAEEKRKKESQLTVQDLERRLKTDMLKIISSTSLSDQRQQKRRRTWCTAPTEQENSLASLTGLLHDSRLMRPSNLSNLPKPTFFPNSRVGYREKTVPKTINILSSLDISTEDDGGINEKFVPAECVNFDTPPPQLLSQKPKSKSRKLPDLALTPVPSLMGPETVEKIKKEIEELHTFTSLEKHFDVEWTEAQVLKESLEKVTAQRDQWEQDCLTKAERCEAMEAEVKTLKVTTEAANTKIIEYEKELKTLKENIAKMELENREAVSLEFQFEAFKKKSSLRENDLLAAISEKELAIENLQRSLDELSRDMVRNSKEALMRSMCPNLVEIGETTLNESDVDVESKKVACECDKFRAEIVATQAKLETMQTELDLAVSEASQKKEDCQQLSEQISQVQADFALLQGRYETLEQSQQEAIETMRADCQSIQQKYNQLQEEYESLERTSNASEEQCQQLQADNTRLQLEVGTLEETQQKLVTPPNSNSLVDEFEAQNNELKAKLAETESRLKDLQEEYDNLSSQLMESFQENDELREELKQRLLASHNLESLKSSGVDSMKSSGVCSEFGEPDQEADSHSDILQQFTKLSESIHQIELKNHSGLCRLFRVDKAEKAQDENVTGFKLCLESARYIEGGDTPQTSASDGTHFKGVLKHQIFQFVALSQEQLEDAEEKRQLQIVAQLEQEIKEKNELLEATEATINEMKEQMTNLQSELFEKSVIVNKVEDYQRQIESLEKQNAEMTIVYGELQDKVHRNSTMSESLLHLMPTDDTISAPSEASVSQSQEVASLAQLKAKVCELQSEIESQLKQMQQKDQNIEELRAEIGEISERCLSAEVKLEIDSREKQDQLDRQSQRLAEDALLIEQLREKNAKLQELNSKLDELQANQEQTIPSSEYERQTKELRLKDDELNKLQLEYMLNLERSENENRNKFREYNQELQELQESKDRYESSVTTLKEQLLQAEEELSRLKDRCQAELDANTITLKNLAEAEARAAQHQTELDSTRETLKEKLDEVEAKQAIINDITSQSAAWEVVVAEQKSALDQLKTENQQLLEQQSEHLAASKNKILELTDKCDEQALELDNLKQDNSKLQAEINQAKEQLLNTTNSLQKLETVMESLSQQKLMAESDFQSQYKALTAKISELEEALQSSQLNAVSHDDLVLKHRELMASSTGKIQELQEMHEQQYQDMDNLRQEKSALQTKIEEADAQHSSTLRKLHDLEVQMDDLSKQRVTEKSELEGKLETVTAKISDLEAEVQAAMLKAKRYDDLISKHEKLKSNLSKAKAVSSNLQEKVDSLQSQLLASEKEISGRDIEIGELRSELRNALAAKDTLNAEKVTLATQLQAVEEKMSSEAGKWKKEVSDLNGSMNELQLKLQSLQEQKGQLEADNYEMKSMLRNADSLQSQLEEEQKLCASLRVQFAKLAETNTRLEDEVRTQEAEVNRKSMEMVKDVELGRQSIGELTKECDKLRCDLEAKTECFQREKQGLDSTISTLLKDKQLLEQKINCLNNVNDSLNAEHQAQLRAKEAETEALREAFTYQKSAAEVVPQMQQKVDELSKEIESLQTTLKSKETSFLAKSQSMDATITSLLEDKRNLEEKQCTLNEIIDKLEAELSALQALKINQFDSFESNTSSGSAPRKSLDCNSALCRKSVGFESEMRKNRRLSVHDEHRRLSYWNNVRDSGTMTDPVDNNCNCTELDGKLQACQQELFIRESQVTALNMELKHHPLKDANAQLKKRVLEEQEKARSEQKRLKMKIHDLNAKVNDLTNAAAAAAKSEPVKVPAAEPSLMPSSSVHTQTECQLEKKYQDALTLLRSRYHIIKDLEEKLQQNENKDTSNVSSLTNGKIHALTKQCEAQKKELASVKEKYETSKRVLVIRKEEMTKMREKLAAFESAPK